jgi:hypothetical protein
MSRSPAAHVTFSMAIWESDVASCAKGNPWSRSFTLIPAPSSSRAASRLGSLGCAGRHVDVVGRFRSELPAR